jgi:hypothetical protein
MGMRTGNLEIELMKAKTEANRWRRISTMLFDAIHDPEARDKAIETYLNYAFPDDDQ